MDGTKLGTILTSIGFAGLGLFWIIFGLNSMSTSETCISGEGYQVDPLMLMTGGFFAIACAGMILGCLGLKTEENHYRKRTGRG